MMSKNLPEISIKVAIVISVLIMLAAVVAALATRKFFM